MLLLTEDGSLFATGFNGDGQLGLGTRAHTSGLVQIPFRGARKIFAGASHSLAITEEGELYVWGWNNYGNLGLGDTEIRTSPVHLPFKEKVKSVATGWSHVLALLEDGTLWSWGDNGSGQVGAGNNRSQQTPIQVVVAEDPESTEFPEFAEFMEPKESRGSTEARESSRGAWLVKKRIEWIGCGGFHSMAITRDGTLYMWGSGHYGKLGNGSTKHVHRPEPVTFRNLTFPFYRHSETEWKTVFRWLFLGFRDSGSEMSQLPVEVLYQFVLALL
jgi:alpha-tubulin suppressor-like RCC1 family protein